jgi:O-antigen/teichoic acid export membrane protein
MELAIQEPVMHGAEVRRRAVASAGVVAIRGAAIRVIGLGGTVVLARLLTPHDFGLVAFGTTLMVFARYLADGGIGAALIRTRETPSLADLQALLGLQLTITSIFAVVVGLVVFPLGPEGRIVAVMVASLPVTAVRVPGTIMLERTLSYRPLVFAEILETLVYFGWAIVTIEAFDWGVWALATGAVVRALVGTTAVALVSPVGSPTPRLSWGRVRSPLLFGARFQGVGMVTLVRDQGVNLGTAAIASVSTLGLWTLAGRILSVPFLAFESLWRIGYPAMARLLGTGEDGRAILERGTSLVATATGATLAPLVAAGPALVPSLFGHKWSAAASVIPWASLGLMVSGPISATAAGYLFALGDAKTVFRSATLNAVAFVAVALPLLRVIGVAALGVGWMASAFVEAFILARGVRAHSDASVAMPLVLPTIAAATAAAAGWLLTTSLPATFVTAALGGLAALAIYLSALMVMRRRLVFDAAGMLGQMMRAGFARA